MKVSVFGLGYVGVVSAACLAKEGHEVIGVDISPAKVELINEGSTPIIESDIGEIISRTVKEGSLVAMSDTTKAIMDSDITLVCVGTPSRPNGSLDLTYIERVCEEIGRILSSKSDRHMVVIRSTVLPGTMRGVVKPIIEESSGKESGVAFGICFNPEFLREGTSVYDYYNPPNIVVGSNNREDAQKVVKLYAGIEAPIFLTDFETAEMVKYVNNVFHALKISFANEVGNICKELRIDSHEVMKIFCSDTKLNLSSYYLKPGFAFGGSCLPKDLRAILYRAKHLDLEVPLLSSIMESNEYQIQRGLDSIMEKGKKKIGILGFSFKEGTDDLRESPMVILVETLLGKGYKLKLYDKNVNLAKLFGANKEYIEQHIEHISNLMTDSIDELIDFAEIVVIGNRSEEFKDILHKLKKDQYIIDLVRIKDTVDIDAVYDGICW